MGSTKKKMPGANRSLLRFMFALCLGAVNSRWGEGWKRIHPLDVISFVSLFRRSSVFKIARYPLSAQASSSLFSFSPNLFKHILGLTCALSITFLPSNGFV